MNLSRRSTEDVRKAYNRIALFIASRSEFLMVELPTLDDDIEIDLRFLFLFMFEPS